MFIIIVLNALIHVAVLHRRFFFMWTVIYIAPTARIAERIKQRLTEEGFLVQVRGISLSKNQFEIVVPAGEVEEVQEVLNSILHR
jgi:hypothetical protein